MKFRQPTFREFVTMALGICLGYVLAQTIIALLKLFIPLP